MKKFMMKSLAVLVAASTLVPFGAVAKAEEAKDVSLTVWGPQEDQTGEQWLQKMGEKFNEMHPEWNIKFEYGVVPEADAKTNLATDAAAGADVYMYANDQLPDLLTANAIAELGGKTVEDIKANNSETTVKTVTYNDGVYGVPFTANTWFMYYDKRVFSEEDITNLDKMLEKGVVSFPLSNSWYIASFYAANGNTIFGDGTDESAGIDWSGDKGTDVTNYLVDLVKNKNFRNDADGVGIAGLADGSINAIFSGTWDYDNVVKALGEENVGIAAAPKYTLNGEEKQLKAFAGSKAIGVNPNSANPEVAVAFAAFLGSKEAQQAHYETRNIIPTFSDIDISGNALAKAQSDAMEFASVVQPLVAAMSNYWTPAQTLGDRIVAGEVTHENAAEVTAATNEAMNTSAVE
ncbi:extracellular solute-binding protein [Aerococcaceae bacterium zg-ZUI334]|uniref:extracellular solute-binding protein n=1 Tax=Aerococcaceae TaxID=186827 RepID=UPI0013B9A698|nr:MULTISPECIES: extracellular solute-binding protein [unclassified Facklamia]MBR7928350.1 extracellular solute-binding protein [Aerococcaceae bacterium zg-ZUI334]MBS4461085.1 extracellular solute-binding protein [Aerococcaceae bacterium zg-B36]QQD64884.1 extracellular solute-binding protein [Aerococcaceae bacterium zg-252]NEW65356.1 extracellular solute-binding protein [Facklamia sp. 252]NEW68508.1 extracellular solute-binding protein [Facklamia sp. 253]